MLEWLRALSDDQRLLLVGLVAQYIVQLEKWIAGRLGWNIEEAKLTKLTLAAVTTAAAAVIVTGYSTAFWREWLLTFAAAVLFHEVGNKALRAVSKEVAQACYMPLLLAGLLCCCCVCGPAVAADLVTDTGTELLTNVAPAQAAPAEKSPWFSEICPSAMKTANSLTSIGTGLSVNIYRFSEDRSLWADGCLLYDGGQDVIGGFAGLSTEIAGLPFVEVILAPLQADCIGAGGKWDGTAEFLLYCTWHF